MAGLIRVAIVEDHPATAQGLAEILAAGPEIEIVGVVGDLAGARGLVATAQPDVVLCDIALPDGQGFELLAERTGEDRPAIIVFSSYDYAAFHRRAEELGATGYLLKTASVADILSAIRTVAAGGTVFDHHHQRAVRSALRPPTGRELQLIRLITAGQSNASIAAELGIGLKSVESHLRRLFDRYAVANRTELAILALREGWLTVPALPPDRSVPDT